MRIVLDSRGADGGGVVAVGTDRRDRQPAVAVEAATQRKKTTTKKADPRLRE